MRILSVGDLHGRYVIDKINPEEYDKIIFVGDYTDSFTKSNLEILHSLNQLIKFARENDNVVLIIGNHDLQYMHPPKISNPYLCSGYRPEAHWDLYDMFKNNIDLFKPIYQIDDTIWTHAGITSQWYNRRFDVEYSPIREDMTIGEEIQDAYNNGLECLFDVGESRGGWHASGGIFWADYSEHARYPLHGCKQIIGHTPRKMINHYIIDVVTNTEHTFIDALTDKDPYNFYEHII